MSLISIIYLTGCCIAVGICLVGAVVSITTLNDRWMAPTLALVVIVLGLTFSFNETPGETLEESTIVISGYSLPETSAKTTATVYEKSDDWRHGDTPISVPADKLTVIHSDTEESRLVTTTKETVMSALYGAVVTDEQIGQQTTYELWMKD